LHGFVAARILDPLPQHPTRIYELCERILDQNMENAFGKGHEVALVLSVPPHIAWHVGAYMAGFGRFPNIFFMEPTEDRTIKLIRKRWD